MLGDNITSYVTIMTGISILDILINIIISYLVHIADLWWAIHLVTLAGIAADVYSLYELNQTLIEKKVASIPQFIMTCFTVLDAFFNGYLVWFSFIIGTWF